MNHQNEMPENMTQKPKIKPLKRWLLPLIIAISFVVLFLFDQEKGIVASEVTWNYFKEMFLILPPVFILMGLIEVWLPKEKIQAWLGKGSGIKGLLISVGLGTLPTGPLYIAFPMTATLMKKGASIRNMVLFLGTWAALKIPQLIIEIEFLGIGFALLRFGLTLTGLIIIGYIIELLIKKGKKSNSLEQEEYAAN
jgi:uncharacterized membrane protein YraQ (UPF0718 family)